MRCRAREFCFAPTAAVKGNKRNLSATNANTLIADYDYFPDSADLRLVQSAIRLSANVLVRDQRQLDSQLTGRLVDRANTVIEALLTQALEKAPRPWLRPIRANLTPPGGPLIRTLEGYTGWVRAVAITADGRRAVSGSGDRTLRLWDLGTGQTLHTLQGHTDTVRAVAVTPDGRRVVSGSNDRRIYVTQPPETFLAVGTVSNRRSSCSSASGIRGRNPPCSQRCHRRYSGFPVQTFIISLKDKPTKKNILRVLLTPFCRSRASGLSIRPNIA